MSRAMKTATVGGAMARATRSGGATTEAAAAAVASATYAGAGCCRHGTLRGYQEELWGQDWQRAVSRGAATWGGRKQGRS